MLLLVVLVLLLVLYFELIINALDLFFIDTNQV